MIEQGFVFVQEWGALIALLLFVLLFIAADLFPRIFGFIAQIESLYPGFELYVLTKEQELIDRYNICLPAYSMGSNFSVGR